MRIGDQRSTALRCRSKDPLCLRRIVFDDEVRCVVQRCGRRQREVRPAASIKWKPQCVQARARVPSSRNDAILRWLDLAQVAPPHRPRMPFGHDQRHLDRRGAPATPAESHGDSVRFRDDRRGGSMRRLRGESSGDRAKERHVLFRASIPTEELRSFWSGRAKRMPKLLVFDDAP